MTTAFRHTVTRTICCDELLLAMRHFLKQNHYQQIPQMSSEQFVQLDSSFVGYARKKRGRSRGIVTELGQRQLDERIKNLQDQIQEMRRQEQTSSPMQALLTSPMHSVAPGLVTSLQPSWGPYGQPFPHRLLP